MRAFCRRGKPVGTGRNRRAVISRHAARQLVKRRPGAYFIGRMALGDPMPEVAAAPSALSRPLVIAAAVAGLLVAGTLALWLHYGTAVFYEIILAGWALCF